MLQRRVTAPALSRTPGSAGAGNGTPQRTGSKAELDFFFLRSDRALLCGAGRAGLVPSRQPSSQLMAQLSCDSLQQLG